MILIENTRGVNVLQSIWRILSLYARFFSCSFITWHCCRDLLRWRQALIEKCLLPLFLIISSPDIYLASFELFGILPWSSSPDNDFSLGSISVSLHTSDIIFDVRSRKSYCRMYRKPLFLQIILCWILNLLPRGQGTGRLYVFPTISESYWIPESLFRLFESKFCNSK